MRQIINSARVAYILGDTTGSRSAGRSDSLSHYLHVYYEDVEALYRERVFELGV